MTNLKDSPGLRILWVIPLIDPRVGGPSTTAVNGVIAEARKGLNVTLLFTEAPGEEHSLNRPAVEKMEAAGVRVIPFSRSLGIDKAGPWGISFPLARWLLGNAGEFDVIHLQYVWAATTIFGTVTGLLRRKPVLLTPHESLTSYDIDLTSGGWFKKHAKLLFRRLVIGGIDMIVYSSELERSDSHLPSKPGSVVPHAVAESARSTPLPEPDRARFTLGFLGRFHPKKNLETILRALSLLEPERFELIVAGAGSPDTEAGLLTLVRDLGLEGRVEWCGHIDVDRRAGFLEEIHLLLMPSDYECFGMVAAESMALGVPALVSDSTGVAGLILGYDAGIVVDEVTPERLARSIRAAEGLGSDQRNRLRENSIGLVEEHLTFDAFATSMIDIYRSA